MEIILTFEAVNSCSLVVGYAAGIAGFWLVAANSFWRFSTVFRSARTRSSISRRSRRISATSLGLWFVGSTKILGSATLLSEIDDRTNGRPSNKLSLQLGIRYW